MYKRKEQGWFKHLDFILLDALCGQLALFLAHGWRHGFRPGLYGIEIYRNLAIWMGLFSVVIAILFNTMHDVLKRGYAKELSATGRFGSQQEFHFTSFPPLNLAL